MAWQTDTAIYQGGKASKRAGAGRGWRLWVASGAARVHDVSPVVWHRLYSVRARLPEALRSLPTSTPSFQANRDCDEARTQAPVSLFLQCN